jgi:hypothetical protein
MFKSKTKQTTPEEREAFIRLMIDVKGVHYAIGHLLHYFRYAKLDDIDEAVITQFHEELLTEKFVLMVDKKDVDIMTS